MKDAIKSTAVSVKNHVHRNRAKYAAGATFAVMLKLQMHTATQWTEFLKEKGIDPLEFFNPEYFEELNS